jgi:oxygen-independent coproporphyrinogen-3 oxidase
MLMMGLRLAEGIPRRRFIEETGQDVEALFDAKALGVLIEGGFLALDDKRLAATEAGRQRLNAVLVRLLG